MDDLIKNAERMHATTVITIVLWDTGVTTFRLGVD